VEDDPLPAEKACQENCCCRCTNVMRQIVSDALREIIITGATGNHYFRVPPPPAKGENSGRPSK